MDIENMSIEKATERCKALTNPEHGCWIGISNQKARETVLSDLEKKENLIKEMVRIDPHIYRIANIRLEEREGK